MRDILYISNKISGSECLKSKKYLNFDLTVLQEDIDEDTLGSSSYRNLVFNAYTVEFFFKISNPSIIEKSAFIFFVDFWENMEAERKKVLEQHLIYLVYDEPHPDLYKKTDKKKYIVVTKKIQAFVLELENTFATELNLFFPLNLMETCENFLNITECMNIMEKKSNFTFELPGSYDIIDHRNPTHLRWNWLEPRPLNTNNIKISIIIPLYNRSHLMSKVLEFLKNQSLDEKYFEVIVIDDGSTDEEVFLTKKILAQLSFKNLIYRYLPREIKIEDSKIVNRAGPARNLGASLSSGEILLFLDSDIILMPNYLENIIEQHNQNDVCIPERIFLSKTATVIINTSNFDSCSKDTVEIPWAMHLKDVFATHDWFKMLPPWKLFMTYALSVKSSVFFKTAGFRTNFISYGYEDLDLGYRICKISNNFKIVTLPCYHLYHFDDKSSEYSCDNISRPSQLAFTSRTFFFQNFPKNAKYLINMAKHSTDVML
jgi:glycosyltransferase involved in cell wall biosynthesis